jgi:6-pyruvoyltetrahydropterin/6-carboxytetrahydropterin synthase
MSAQLYTVRVTKDYLVFSAGHFITYEGDRCERIHGHNWRIAVEVGDILDQNHYVFDFIALRDHTQLIAAELDHRMLLPGQSHLISLKEDGPNWLVRFRDRYWSFPRDECVILPIPNTTTELIAKWIGERLVRHWSTLNLRLPQSLKVEVEENFGQTAWSEWCPSLHTFTSVT